MKTFKTRFFNNTYIFFIHHPQHISSPSSFLTISPSVFPAVTDISPALSEECQTPAVCTSTCRSSSLCLLKLEALLKKQTVDFSWLMPSYSKGSGERRVDVAPVGHELDLLCPLSTPPPPTAPPPPPPLPTSKTHKAVIPHRSAAVWCQSSTFDDWSGRSNGVVRTNMNIMT